MNKINFLGPEPVLMGIVNVTPDSFFDGGQFIDPDKAIAHGLRLARDGAHILDIGGESTRPGAIPVSSEEEQKRVIPVLEGLRNCGALLSIDTRHADTMRAAIVAGAGMINDVSALTYDSGSLPLIAKNSCYVCLMHMQGEPETMQINPSYDDVLQEVFQYLKDRIDVCLGAGINRERIVIDPGIGFGKTFEQNIFLLKNIDKFKELGVPVLLGVSRKKFIEYIVPKTPANQRLAGSIASVLAAYGKGVRIFRVHDVAETAQALAVFRRL